MTNLVLIADDDPHIRDVLVFALEKAGMAVQQAADGMEALALALERKPDILILDITMPKLDGLDVCRRLRSHPDGADLPILFLSSRDEEVDRIVGLEIGGDDYVTKPFSPREITARIQAILKRTQRAIPAPDIHHARGHLRLDADGRSVTWQGKAVSLTVTEFDLLQALMTAPAKIFSRDDLMTKAYGAHVAVSDRTIDSHLRNVRSKIAELGGDDIIVTVHGVGYRLGSCAT
jgi:two-component system, OmpR family, response regulator